MNQSARVTPKGGFSVGATYMVSIPQQTLTTLTDQVEYWSDNYSSSDSITMNDAFNQVNRALLSYSIDPVANGPQFYLRYGLLPRTEISYLRSGKSNQIQVQYQFIGPEAGKDAPEERWYASAGLQYSSTGFRLPKFFGFVQSHLNYSFKRRDLLLPLTASYSFGPDERYGSVSFGLVYGHHFVRYSMIPNQVFDENGLPAEAVSYRTDYNSWAFFTNVKFGYKYLYIIPSLSVYSQDYGSYRLLTGSAEFRGVTVVPAVSVELNLYGWKKKKS